MARRMFQGRQTEKEEITWSDIGINASTSVVKPIVKAENSPTTAGEVEIGSHVKSIFFEINFSAETITSTKIVHWFVVFSPLNAISSNPTVYDSAGKRFILKRGMEMLPKDVGTVIKRVFVVKLPPKFVRFGDADQLNLVYQASSSESINVCGFAIYRHAE